MDKTVIWYRTPPTIYQMQCICVGEVSRIPTEFNYFDSFKSYGIFSDSVVPMVLVLSLSSPSSPHHPCVILIAPKKVPMWSPSSLSSPLSPLSPPMLSPSSLSPPTYGWVHELVGGWVDGWVNGWDQVKSLKIK